MDCKHFRKHHLAYLDDTLPGELMASAQHHVMVCDGCAAHDTLVRRSLMVARSLPTLEPSSDFQEKLRARLAACRSGDEVAPRVTDHVVPGVSPRPTRALVAVAASAVLGVMAWNAFRDTPAPELSMQPVIASRPATPPVPYLSPAVMQMMATGNPVWPAAMMVEDVPTHFVNADFSLADMR
jgi:hypothetical protein